MLPFQLIELALRFRYVKNLWNSVIDFFNQVHGLFSTFKIIDAVDILFVAFMLYVILRIIRDTRAMMLIRGIILFAALYLVVTFFGMSASSYILRSVFANDFNLSFVYAGGFSSPEDLFKQNWKILYLNEYLDRIKSNEIKYSYYLSLKSTVGLTPNFGGLASYYNKMMVCAQVSWLSSNKVVFDFGLDVAF